MEITKQQLEDIAKLVGEKELRKIIPESFYLTFDRKKIYVLKGTYIYKLHRILDTYAFVDLFTSDCYANGTGTADDQISYARSQNALFEFDTYKDFVLWLNDNLD